MAKEFKTKEIKGTRSVGERLRLARRRKRITLEVAEVDTKIRFKYLEALEGGHYAVLPSEVYALGFLRRYAEYLGLKPETLTALYKGEWNSAMRSNKIAEDFSPVKKVRDWQLSITPKTIAICTAFLLVAGLLGYIWLSIRNFSAPPKLAISEPKSYTTITGDALKISGTTDAGSYVYINNEPVPVAPNGSFNQDVNLGEEMSTVEIVAKNRLKRRTVKIIKVVWDNGTAEARRKSDSNSR